MPPPSHTSALRSFVSSNRGPILACLPLAALAVLSGSQTLAFDVWIPTILVLAVACGLAVAVAAFHRPPIAVGRGWIAAVLALGIAFRVGAMSSDRMVCTDAARYLWDGKVLANGLNPYAHAPSSPALDHLRTDPIDYRINMPEVRTPYPPLAELVFLLAYALTPGRLLGYQMINLVLEVGAWLILLGLLERLRLPMARILLFAWAPLLVIEGYLPGHSDVLALPLICLLIRGVLSGRPALCGLSLAAAIMVKPLAVFLVPAAARELGIRGASRMLAVCCAVLAAVYVPILISGPAHLGPMALMAARWSFNGIIVKLLGTALPETPLRIASFAVMAALVAAGTALGRDFLSRCLISMAAVFAMSPVVYPWYVVWIVPLVVLRPDPALIALSILIPITDIAAIGASFEGRGVAPLWSTLVAFLPFHALMIAGLAGGWGMFERRLACKPVDREDGRSSLP